MAKLIFVPGCESSDFLQGKRSEKLNGKELANFQKIKFLPKNSDTGKIYSLNQCDYQIPTTLDH